MISLNPAPESPPRLACLLIHLRSPLSFSRCLQKTIKSVMIFVTHEMPSQDVCRRHRPPPAVSAFPSLPRPRGRPHGRESVARYPDGMESERGAQDDRRPDLLSSLVRCLVYYVRMHCRMGKLVVGHRYVN